MIATAQIVIFLTFPVIVHSGLLRGQRPRHPAEVAASSFQQERANHKKRDLSDHPAIPSTCLDDPDDPACHQILVKLRIISNLFFGDSATGSAVFLDRNENLRRKNDPSTLADDEESTLSKSSKSSEPLDFYTEEVVSSSPTRDLCYGNMERLPYKKFCHSEMPSVSLEPTDQPTEFPHGDKESGPWGAIPSIPVEPSPTPTLVPSVLSVETTTQRPTTQAPLTPTPTAATPRLGMCAGDCNSPADCDSSLYCYQRLNFEEVPGCPLVTALDSSRTDYCTNVTRPITETPSPPDEDSFRLKLYWNSSYWWQESNTEVEWCMTCPNHHPASATSCQEGDNLFLHYCSSDSVRFDFIFDTTNTSRPSEEEWLIQVVGTVFCLQHADTSASLAICNTTNPHQHWTATLGSNVTLSEPFEIGPRPDQFGSNLCLTIHHHPKFGEEIELYPCSVARNDNSSLWTMF